VQNIELPRSEEQKVFSAYENDLLKIDFKQLKTRYGNKALGQRSCARFYASSTKFCRDLSRDFGCAAAIPRFLPQFISAAISGRELKIAMSC
jgi:hypothetical protein